jgi:hypothetical protein
LCGGGEESSGEREREEMRIKDDVKKRWGEVCVSV